MKAFEMLYIGNNFNFIVGQFTLKFNDKNNRVKWSDYYERTIFYQSCIPTLVLLKQHNIPECDVLY